MAKIALLNRWSAILCGHGGDMLTFMPAPGDRTDRAILATLQRDGRIANVDLAEAVSLSPSACLRRVKGVPALGRHPRPPRGHRRTPGGAAPPLLVRAEGGGRAPYSAAAA